MDKLKIVFMGTPQFSVPILEALINKYEVIGVVTQPDKEVGRKKILTPSPVKECALKYNIPVFQPRKIRKEFEDIKNLNPDIIITAAYGQIVGMELLNSPKYRSINVHGSLLPKYRGGAPIQRAIMNGDSYTGITIMYMEKGMDSGDILSQKELEILDSDNNETVFEKMSYLGRDLLLETLPLLIEGKLTPIKQDESLVTYAYNIEAEEEKLDFSKDAKDVFNHIRALSPTPGAYFTLGNEKIKIFSSKVSDLSHKEETGSIINVSKKGFMIACGNHTVLEILEIQQTGKNKISARDFAKKGINLSPDAYAKVMKSDNPVNLASELIVKLISLRTYSSLFL